MCLSYTITIFIQGILINSCAITIIRCFMFCVEVWCLYTIVIIIIFKFLYCKTYFVTSNFINMLYCFVVVFIVIVISGTGFNFIALTYLPLIMIIEYIFTLGITLFASAITVYLRDVKYILSILVFAWQMFTPVMFPSTLVPTHLLKLWYMNPMTPIVEAYRSILFYKEIPQLTTLISACGFGLFFIVFGEFVFSKLQKGFAEEL